MRIARLMSGAALIAIATPILASETITYTYDAKGRLTKVVRTGSVNNAVTAQYAYDKADNRSTVSTTGSPNSPPTPPPPPPPSNSPPVPGSVATQSVPRCTAKNVNVTTGATDPENNVPITVTAANASSGKGVATVVSGQVNYEAFTATGTDIVTYTLADSLGATANGTFSVNITAGTCN